MSENVIIELGLSFDVEGETTNPEFFLAVDCEVTVVSGSTRAEFEDVVAWIEFVGEVAEGRLHGQIVASLDKESRIGMEVESPLTEMFEDLVELKSGMACR